MINAGCFFRHRYLALHRPYIQSPKEIPDCAFSIHWVTLHKGRSRFAPMLGNVLAAMNQPVKAEVIKEIITYMKGMPKDQEALVLQCAEHLEATQSLGAVLAVVHALNEGEFLLKCRDDDDTLESDLTKELEKLMNEDRHSAELAA